GTALGPVCLKRKRASQESAAPNVDANLVFHRVTIISRNRFPERETGSIHSSRNDDSIARLKSDPSKNLRDFARPPNPPIKNLAIPEPLPLKCALADIVSA